MIGPVRVAVTAVLLAIRATLYLEPFEQLGEDFEDAVRYKCKECGRTEEREPNAKFRCKRCNGRMDLDE